MKIDWYCAIQLLFVLIECTRVRELVHYIIVETCAVVFKKDGIVYH